MRALWTCARCRRSFANRNQQHSCTARPIAEHFRNRPDAKALFRVYLDAIRRIGPVTVVSSATRIGIQTRMIFSAVMPRKDYLRAHLVLARRARSARFIRIDTISVRNHVHLFELRDVRDIDAELLAFVREAYAVGNQEHLLDAARQRD